MHEILHLVYEMAPFLLLGFFLAGLFHAFIPATLYVRFLASQTWRSVFYATLMGIPLPLCSCGVIPTAISLRKKGASRGATVSFLIATPQTGIDALMATYSLMDFPLPSFALWLPYSQRFSVAQWSMSLRKFRPRWKQHLTNIWIAIVVVITIITSRTVTPPFGVACVKLCATDSSRWWKISASGWLWG